MYGHIGIMQMMENKMETTILYRGYIMCFKQVLETGAHRDAQALVFGSRGGQVAGALERQSY